MKVGILLRVKSRRISKNFEGIAFDRLISLNIERTRRLTKLSTGTFLPAIVFHLSPFSVEKGRAPPRLNFGSDLRSDYANLFCESALRKIVAMHYSSRCIISARSCVLRRNTAIKRQRDSKKFTIEDANSRNDTLRELSPISPFLSLVFRSFQYRDERQKLFSNTRDSPRWLSKAASWRFRFSS